MLPYFIFTIHFLKFTVCHKLISNAALLLYFYFSNAQQHNNHINKEIMKVRIHRESIKQKEIVKTSIFLTVGLIYLVVKIVTL